MLLNWFTIYHKVWLVEVNIDFTMVQLYVIIKEKIFFSFSIRFKIGCQFPGVNI